MPDHFGEMSLALEVGVMGDLVDNYAIDRDAIGLRLRVDPLKDVGRKSQVNRVRLPGSGGLRGGAKAASWSVGTTWYVGPTPHACQA